MAAKKASLAFSVIVFFACLTSAQALEPYSYLQSKLRVLSELKPFQDRWCSLENDVFSITSADQTANWESLNDKGISLLKTGDSLLRHFSEDARRIRNQLDPKRWQRIQSFMETLFMYLNAVDRMTMKLAEIVNHLYKRSLAPYSYTAETYRKDLTEYQALRREHSKYAIKLNQELTTLRQSR